MNKEQFELKMTNEFPKVYDDNQRMELIKKSVISNLGDGNPIGHRNLIIVTEELAELTQQVTKELRGKGDRLGMIEEMANVILGIDYLKFVCNISDQEIYRACNIKLERLENVLNAKNRYL